MEALLILGIWLIAIGSISIIAGAIEGLIKFIKTKINAKSKTEKMHSKKG